MDYTDRFAHDPRNEEVLFQLLNDHRRQDHPDQLDGEMDERYAAGSPPGTVRSWEQLPFLQR